jgi:hypothetical protein
MTSDKSVKMGGKHSAPFGGVYFLGIVGSAVYFVQNTDGFWRIILAVLKAFVWPAFMVHRAFELMGM